ILAVLPRQQKVRIKPPRGTPVRQMLEPHPRLEQHHLVELACHGHAPYAVTTEVADRAAQLSQADPLKVVANVSQCGVRMLPHSEAINLISLLLERLGNDQRITAPGSYQ